MSKFLIVDEDLASLQGKVIVLTGTYFVSLHCGCLPRID
jgi:hypothetical protein